MSPSPLLEMEHSPQKTCQKLRRPDNDDFQTHSTSFLPLAHTPPLLTTEDITSQQDEGQTGHKDNHPYR